jgi:hypothetical protein
MFKQIRIPQQSWASGSSAARSVKLNDQGQVSQISFKANNTTNAITFTLTISDENSGQLYTKAAIPRNATTVYHATKDTEDFHEFIIGPGCTATITPSGDPGASGAAVDVILGVEE